MPGVDHFIDEVVTGFRQRLALLPDGGDRRAIEDGIALLTHCLRSGTDEAQLETLLSTLRAGRSPAGLPVLKPEVVAREITRHWQQYRSGVAVAALN
jgi:hypothetical protein